MDSDRISNSSVQVALVTGASRGIGKAISIRLLEDGFFVVGTSTSEEGASRISGYESESGKKCKGLKLDVSESDDVTNLITAISSDYASPLLLINNAGVTADNLLLRMKENDWNRVLNTNLNSIYYLTKSCLKGMTRARWGRIINITSVVASMGNPGQTNYAASKAGIEGFTRSLACEVGQRNITVNCVSPGFVDTDMTKALPEDQRKALISKIPLRKFGSVDDVASIVSFLCSEGANYITGETIQINGGMYLR